MIEVERNYISIINLPTIKKFFSILNIKTPLTKDIKLYEAL